MALQLKVDLPLMNVVLKRMVIQKLLMVKPGIDAHVINGGHLQRSLR